MKLLLIITTAFLFSSCYKEYVAPEPTCNWVHMLIDNYNPDTSYNGHTDTFWFSGVRGKVGILCDSDLLRVKKYVPFLKGCERDGYTSIRYVIGNHKTQPTIF